MSAIKANYTGKSTPRRRRTTVTCSFFELFLRATRLFSPRVLRGRVYKDLASEDLYRGGGMRRKKSISKLEARAEALGKDKSTYSHTAHRRCNPP